MKLVGFGWVEDFRQHTEESLPSLRKLSMSTTGEDEKDEPIWLE